VNGPAPPTSHTCRLASKRSKRWRALILGVFLIPLVCGATFGSLLIVGQASGTSPLPPSIAASLEDLAIEAGILQAPPALRATATAGPPIVYVEAPRLSDTQLLATEARPTTSGEAALELSSTPEATFAPAETATVTNTQAVGVSPSPTSTLTVTGTFASSATPSSTFTSPSGASATPSRTPTRTQTHTPTRTMTPEPPTSSPVPATQQSSLTPQQPSPTPQQPTQTDTGSTACAATGNPGYETTVLDLINQERQNQGLPAYALSGQLRSAARGHSQDMACNEFFSHTGSDGSSVGDRVSAEGYGWSWVGENIFATSISSSAAPQQAFDWWMNSPGHRANILNVNFTEIGIGYVYSAESTYGSYFTAVFARP